MKQKPRDKERLEHILEAANNIQEFSSGLTYAGFLQNKMLQYAIVKNFEIIGEAAYHLSKEIREKSQDKIEWRKIMAFRHILVHDYWMIDYEKSPGLRRGAHGVRPAKKLSPNRQVKTVLMYETIL